ncbi:hypothetical protein [Laspinema olomoucense]|uniref:Uncharacterized protein n=1 Tax=Laspinema olomoucense D3b TaxID=2953688 RepID=A0ABT2N8G1_9CYAN|nr:MULTISPECIES: hypothetical protein [unclassified Laspinema]MCT7978973.1 hypothetical protein [Laspinema sp. D3b]MCT7991901.1 hypothetical protein [Laspinema sp. D3a]
MRVQILTARADGYFIALWGSSPPIAGFPPLVFLGTIFGGNLSLLWSVRALVSPGGPQASTAFSLSVRLVTHLSDPRGDRRCFLSPVKP